MPSNTQRRIGEQIAALLAQRGVQACTDLSATDAHGYRVILGPHEDQVTVCYVEARRGSYAYEAQMRFLRTYEPILAQKFGTVTRIVIRLRIGGRLRPAHGLMVTVSR